MLIALVHLLATTTMAGLIWFVQVVHYPLFAHVPASASAAYLNPCKPAQPLSKTTALLAHDPKSSKDASSAKDRF